MFLSIKKIPEVSWSSKNPFNIKPKFSSIFFLCLGLIFFGLGEGLLIVSNSGASPWSVLAQGISLNINLSIGVITLIISITVFLYSKVLCWTFIVFGSGKISFNPEKKRPA